MSSYKEINDYRIVRPGIGLSLLGCTFLFCLIVASLIIGMLSKIIARPEAALRIGTVVQDFMVFIIPAITTAMVTSRLPARLLAVDRWPGLRSILLTLLTLCVSVPAMNVIIEWNQNLHLPESMAKFEAGMRAMEDAAAESAQMLIGGSGAGSLILAVLIVGVLAGFSEELFFRGAFQRLLGMTRLNRHMAIWIAAFVFSAIHFQFFGFIPRLLLGAFFGYLLWWSGSLWLPVIAHIFNNTVVVLSEYIQNADATACDINAFGVGDIPVTIASIILTVAGIWLVRKSFFYLTSSPR